MHHVRHRRTIPHVIVRVLRAAQHKRGRIARSRELANPRPRLAQTNSLEFGILWACITAPRAGCHGSMSLIVRMVFGGGLDVLRSI